MDLFSEARLGLAEAAALVPPARNGRKTHISTLLRWIISGAKAPDGRRVRLEAARIGSRWFTSVEALERFSAALTPTADRPPPIAPRTPSARQRASGRAETELERAGI